MNAVGGWFADVIRSILNEIKSRKFRALAVVLAGILTSLLSGELLAEAAAYAAVVAIAGYIFGVALEDGLRAIG